MKIEILICEDINETCTGMTCFEASDYVIKAIAGQPTIKGIVIINNNAVKFSFSSMSMDGNIFTDKVEYRMIVKYIIPIYVFNTIKE
jgi:hypothetical protein